MKASKTSSKNNVAFIKDAMNDLREKHDQCLELAYYSKELKKLDGEFYEIFYAMMKEVNALSTEV